MLYSILKSRFGSIWNQELFGQYPTMEDAWKAAQIMADKDRPYEDDPILEDEHNLTITNTDEDYVIQVMQIMEN